MTATTNPSATGLFALIDRVLPDGGQWCTTTKAHTLASLVLALRPRAVVEIGVWMGGSLIPLALAVDFLRRQDPTFNGTVLAIDPWSASASIEGQDGENLTWWSAVDHESAFSIFQRRVEQLKLGNVVQIDRRASDDVAPPTYIDLIHIDGNHAEQALRDAQRFLPNVAPGGIVILDDVGWAGGGVSRALAHAESIGFSQCYPLDTGVVLQRTRTA